MKRILVTLAAVFFFSSMLAHAGDMSVSGRMGRKAVRGAVDLVTGIVEMPMQIYKGYDKGFGPIKNKPASKTVGVVLGFFRGIGHAAGRMAGGARDLVCFWSADQATNKGIGVPFDAEYSWEMGQQHSYFKPTVKEGVAPVGRKFALGVANAFTGIVEVPSQLAKANRQDESMVVGAGRGVYYFISRTIYGATDMMGFCLIPNQEDTYGYPYSSRYAWGELSGAGE